MIYIQYIYIHLAVSIWKECIACVVGDLLPGQLKKGS